MSAKITAPSHEGLPSACSQAALHSCIGSFHETPADSKTAIVAFLRDGWLKGARCLCLGGETTASAVLAALAPHDGDKTGVERLSVVTLNTRQGAPPFKGVKGLRQFLHRWAAAAQKTGNAILYVAADMASLPCSRRVAPSVLEYAQCLNELALDYPLVVLCSYLRTEFHPECIRDAVAQHPWILSDNGIRENPYFALAGDELAKRQTDCMLAGITAPASAPLARDRVPDTPSVPLDSAARLLDAIHKVQTQYIWEGDPGTAFALLLDTLVSLTESEHGFLDEVCRDADGTPYKLSLALSNIAWDEGSTHLYEKLAARRLEFRNLDNLAGLPAKTGKLTIANDPSQDARATGLPPGHPRLKSFMGIPLYFAGELIGVAGVANRTEGYSVELAEFLEPFCSTCACLIHATRQKNQERQRSEEIEDLASRYHAIQATTLDGFMLVGPSGEILEVNDVYRDMSGYTRQELLSMRVADLDVAETSEEISAHMESLRRQGCDRFETQHRTKTGRILTIQVSTMFLDRGDRIITFLRDITEERRGARALAASEERFRTVADWTYDWEYWTAPDGSVRYISPSCTRVTGYTPEEFETEPALLHLIVYEEDRPCWDRHLVEGICRSQEEDVTQCDLRIVRKDGGLRWIAHICRGVWGDDGRYLGIRASNRDITEQKILERAQKESEERYRLIVETANEGIWAMDAQYRTSYVNAHMAAMLGYREDEMLGLPVESFMFKEDLAAHRNRMAARARCENGNYETRFAHKNGSAVWTIVSATALADSDGCFAGSFAMFTDITERKKTEEALRMSHDWLKVAQRASLSGLWDWSMLDSRFTWTEEFYELFGLPTTAEPCVETWLDVVLPEDREPAMHRIEESIRTHVPLQNEYRILLPGGRLRWIGAWGSTFYSDTGEPLRMCGICIDITPRKQSEMQIRASERLFRVLSEQLPDLVWQKDRGGVYISCNQHYADTLGRSCESVVGLRDDDLYPREIAQKYHDGDEQVLTTGLAIEVEEVVERGGSPAWYSTRKVPVFDDSGCIIGTIGIARDITERKKTDDSLRFQATILSQISDMVTATDLEGVITYVNEAETRVVGRSRDELIGRPVTVYGEAPDVGATQVEIVRETLANGHWQGEVVNRNAHGHEIIVFCRTHLIHDLSGRAVGMCGIGTDITERKRAEQALRDSERRYRMLFQNLSAGFALHEIILDTDGTPCDYRFLEVNRAFEAMTGLTAQALLGKTVLEVMPNTEHKWIEVYGDVAVNGRAIRFESHSDVLQRDYDVVAYSPEPNRFAVVFLDISDRKRAEQASRLHAAMMENVAEGIMLIGLTDAVVRWANDKMESLFGYAPREMQGLHLDTLIAAVDESPVALRTTVSRALRTCGEWHGEIRNTRKDGSILWTHANVSLFNHPEYGEVALAVHSDITERKQSEEEQERLRGQLLQSQKMEAVGQLAGGVAHDFNNILQVVMGYAGALLDDPELPPATQEAMSDLLGAAERGARLVKQLLAFSRRQVMRLELLNINEVIANLLKMLERVIGEHIRLVFIPAANAGVTEADRGMIEQVLMNLCVNARDAMGSEGTLTIETHGVTLDRDFCTANPWAVPGRYVLLSVTDTGCGMDQDMLERAFEPFFTTKEQGRGTGLGLATVYGIIRQHEGMVRIYSEVGAGTEFKVYLPSTDRSPDRAQATSSRTVLGGTETILLAEDDESVRRLTTRLLQRSGYTVIEAADGQEAVARFREHAHAVDLLLLDVVMPGMGGRQAYDEIQQLLPGLPALFASGYSEGAIHTNFILGEGMRLIQKPYTSQDLLAKIREILDGSP